MAKCRHAFDRTLWLDKPVPNSHQIETTCTACGGFIGRRYPERQKASKAKGQDAEEHAAAEKRAEAESHDDLFTGEYDDG